ncbi:ATP-grasp domain-containing protein [Virgibacillus ainsalahensis]
MERINVLVTGIGGPTAQGILRGLKEKEDIHLVGTDRRRVTAGNFFCDTVYQPPRYTELEDYKKAITDIIDKENIHAVFPTLHDEIEIYEKFRRELNAEVALPVSDHFDILNDKERAYQYLSEKGLHSYIPKYRGFTNTAELPHIVEKFFPEDDYICVK